MSRDIKTVPDAWNEFVHGTGLKTSVESIEKEFGTAWRKNAAETKYYLRRKVIIDAIKKVLADYPDVTELDAVSAMEYLRAGKTLNQLQKVVQAQANDWYGSVKDWYAVNAPTATE
jgi:hypothetical protein